MPSAAAASDETPHPDRHRRLRLREPAAQEAVVQVRLVAFEHVLAVLQPPRDDERRVDDRHGEHEQREEQGDGRRSLQQALHRHGREHEAEQERARVAHEDPRRVEVVAQEAERRAEHDRREDGRIRLPERQRDDRERPARDRGDARSEPVEPVEEVDHVHDRDDPDHGQRHPDPRRERVDRRSPGT